MTEVEAAKKWKSREDLLITRSHLCIGGGVYGIGVREEGGIAVLLSVSRAIASVRSHRLLAPVFVIVREECQVGMRRCRGLLFPRRS